MPTSQTQTSHTTPPIPIGRFWAKWDEPTRRWHPLTAHCADVAAVMAELLAPNSPLAARLAGALGESELHPAHRTALVYLTALHDLGKVNHGFQTKNRPPGERGRWSSRGHVKPLLCSLEIAPVSTVIAEALSALPSDEDDAYELFRSVLCHHGRPWDESGDDYTLGALWRADAERDPVAGMNELIACARRWSGIDAHIEAPPLRPTPEFTHLLAGAVMLADWIGSTESIFPLCPEADADPDGYWLGARVKAATACRGIGLIPGEVARLGEGRELLRRLFPAVFGEETPSPAMPTALQRCAATMELPPSGSRLLIESETGSGKTEAALALYARLRAAGQVGGLVFALPTRATASAMYRRVCEAVRAMYPADARPSIALAIGGDQPRTESTAREFGEEPRQDPDPEDEVGTLSGWASESAKRYLAAEIVVGTLDQVLLAGLAVRHAHLRLAALSRHLLVVDELHSFDRYMATVLEQLLRQFTAAGGIALFMSATLSDVERRRFGGADAPETTPDEAATRAYPLLSLRTPSDPDWTVVPLMDATPRPPKSIAWKEIHEVDAAAEAISSARAGARVCVLRNTVRGALAILDQIREQGGESSLWKPSNALHAPGYHSRYTLPDRQAIDEAVLLRFGKSVPHGGGTILVATQVVEQSLDVDFDLLITDLCPIDVLLQRIGRLHRHRQRDAERPLAFREPRCFVLCPDEGVEPYRERKYGGPHGWGTVYPDLADLHLTLALVRKRVEILIPTQNRELIEAVYHPFRRELLEGGGDPVWSEYMARAEGAQNAQEYHAKSASLHFRESYIENGFRYQQEVARRTRLGDDAVRINLAGEVRCWYSNPAEPVRHVDLPYRALRGVDLTTLIDPIPTEQIEGETRFRLGEHLYRYTPIGWVWEKLVT